jgi:Tol biopolymer transport system component
MSARQRRIFSVFGVVIFVLGGGLGVWAVISEQEEVIVGSMAWSPDGQRLVFAWNHALYTMNIDGTHLHQLSSMNGDYLESAWSPSGDRIG